MLTRPGDIVYAYRKTKAPSKRALSFRFGLQRPVLRLEPLSYTDDNGYDWIAVLPVPKGVLATRLIPDNIILIPMLDCASLKERIADTVLEVITRVLRGEHPDYPWIGADVAVQHQATDYPTVDDALRRS